MWRKPDVEYECDFIYHGSDHFGFTEEGNPTYFDGDGVRTDFSFNGWVNKTGKTVTIENLHFPEGDKYLNTNYVKYQDCDGDWVENEDGESYYEETCWTTEYTEFNYEYVGRPVSNDCNYYQECRIVFYGDEGLVFNGKFTMSPAYRTHSYVEYADDGNDTHYKLFYYENYTVIFDLPFEPYGFSLQNDGTIYRIF